MKKKLESPPLPLHDAEEDEIKKDEERLSLLQKKLEEVRNHRIEQEMLKEARNKERQQKKLEYLCAIKLQRGFYHGFFARKYQGRKVLYGHLRSKMYKQSITVAAWAARVIKSFAILVRIPVCFGFVFSVF